MTPIIQPSFYCPFPSAISVHAAAVQRTTLNWVRRFQLIRGEPALQRLDRRRYGELIARAYPHASREALQIISDWNTWLFLLDDQCDETGLGKDPVRLAQVHARLLAILRGTASPNHGIPQEHALSDLVGRLRARAGETWLRRFIVELQDYFTANVWEATNRLQGTTPDLATYRAMRQFTGAVYSYLDLIEVADGLQLPPGVYNHPDVRRLAQMTNNSVCWSNDIISLDKELQHGDVHNLVVILCAEQQISLQDAVDQVAALHDAEVRAFVELAARLPSFGTALDPDLRRYVAGMQCWIRANLDWSAATARYRPTSQPLPAGSFLAAAPRVESHFVDMGRLK